MGAGYAGYSFLGNNANADAPNPSADAKTGEAKIHKTSGAFTGGDQGFLDLKLKEVQDYNHNTKIFKFELPEADQVSGLSIACKLGQRLTSSGACY